MPYELTFSKPIQVPDPEIYINDCCQGGDVVAEALLPALKQRYPDCPDADQEDWGWFIWFADGAGRLAVDIYCEDPTAGAFKIHLTSRQERFLLPSKVVDTPQLEALRTLIVNRLAEWVGVEPTVELLDSDYMPKSG